eukprot:GFUD01138110.1.p1 GENE.GFUD01138110.1~~GFUD01138110.1.p1  ORF type:complete len:216 (+),score=43.47 GFUD01138110.1:42-689(+)
MFSFLNWKVCSAAVGIVIGSELLWKLLLKFRKHLKKSDFEVNEVLFFPDNPLTTFENNKSLIKHSVAIDKSSSLYRLTKVISGTQKSLDMCLFLITLRDMASLAIRLMQDGVRVRVIVDHSNQGISGCQVGRLREAGVRVVARKQAGLMHHKFAVVDGRLLVTGSFNWTSQAVMSNNENVVITSNKELVEPFVCEFERLWEENSPVDAMLGRGDW